MSEECEALSLYWEERVDGAVPDDVRERLERHLEGCADCRRGYGETVRVIGRLRAAADADVSDAAAHRIVEAAARAAGRVRRRRPGGWIAAAAALLMSLGGIWVLGGGLWSDGALLVTHGSLDGGVFPAESVTVEVKLGTGRPAHAGQPFAIYRWGRKIGDGALDAFSTGTGLWTCTVAMDPGATVSSGDAVKLGE